MGISDDQSRIVNAANPTVKTKASLELSYREAFLLSRRSDDIEIEQKTKQAGSSRIKLSLLRSSGRSRETGFRELPARRLWDTIDCSRGFSSDD